MKESNSRTIVQRVKWFCATAFDVTRNKSRLLVESDGFHAEAKEYLSEKDPHADKMKIDALRHSYVSARMCQKYGHDYAAVLGYAQEFRRDLDGTNNPYERGMDLHNNGVGRRLASEVPGLTSGEMLDILSGKLYDGGLITAPYQDPRAIKYSYGCEPDHPLSSVLEVTKNALSKVYALKATRLNH